jgi:hypothetical protein
MPTTPTTPATHTTSGGSSTVEPLFGKNDKIAAAASLVVGVVMYTQGYNHYILGSIGASIVAKGAMSYYDSMSAPSQQAKDSIQPQH